MSARLPALRPADLGAGQRELYDNLVANEVPQFDAAGVEVISADGSLLGPFNPLLFSPDLGTAQIGVFRADKAHTSLPPRIREIVILTVGAAWGSDYELYAHRIVGRIAGLPQDLIEALISGEQPDFEDEAEASVYEFTRQLTTEHKVDRQTYARAERELGPKGLVDTVLLVGLYSTVCALINAFEVPVPAAAGAKIA
jgi:4-carboxymuconolactone decarboxylase